MIIFKVFVIISTICLSNALVVLEGKTVTLDFFYLCESTDITLQHRNKIPFYGSSDPNRSQDPRYQINNTNNATESGKCSLRLTINTVSRDDIGTYILIAYMNDKELDYTRIYLGVRYPPGWVSCKPKPYDRNWTKLLCRAQVGSIPGKIECFQNEVRLPPLTEPEENYMELSQVILARLDGNPVMPVYCCSTTLSSTPEFVECKDWIWDPMHVTNQDNKDPYTETMESSPPATFPNDPVIYNSPSKESSMNLLKSVEVDTSVSKSETNGMGWFRVLCIILVGTCLIIACVLYIVKKG